ncbi:hypothetical protein BS47DRAFT_350322 [Hydnum rufescens UP504]|uniref:HhH-GPD domain-containing protein n=1 Tax=Hydnum rufescens UP504 TaxID=1448309 RepID=A0A9P6AK73_9AGAM|nr:hypothetical protein BS47DRAFT_350322 [Hydnum rufescens UP504]
MTKSKMSEGCRGGKTMTQITTVIPCYNRRMDAFLTLKALSNATIEDVNQRWKGLGYYSRAARLLAAAQKVVGELGDRLPQTAVSMEKQLPGVVYCSLMSGSNAKTPLEAIWKAACDLVR